jgi:hypothetical protein
MPIEKSASKKIAIPDDINFHWSSLVRQLADFVNETASWLPGG